MKRRPFALLAAAAALACSGGDEPTRRDPPPTPPPPAEAPAPAAEAAGPADATRGEPLYATYCASCHGLRGAGDGPVAASLEPRPARHDDGARMNTLSNEELFRVIQEGGPATGRSPLMAPWGGTLDPAQIRDVIAFIRSLAKPPYAGPMP